MRFPYLGASPQQFCDPPLCRSGSKEGQDQAQSTASAVPGVVLPRNGKHLNSPNKWDALVQPLNTPLCIEMGKILEGCPGSVLISEIQTRSAEFTPREREIAASG